MTAPASTLPDDELVRRLRIATRPDLEGLLSDLRLRPAQHQGATHEQVIERASRELRSAAGNSLRNLTRSPHAFPYKQIVIDVADKLCPRRTQWTRFRLSGPESVQDIEDTISGFVQQRVNAYLAKVSDSKRSEIEAELVAQMRSRGYPEHAIQSALTGLATGALTGLATGPAVAALLMGNLWTAIFGFSLAQLRLEALQSADPSAWRQEPSPG